MICSKTPQARTSQNMNLQTDFVKNTPKDKNQKQTDLFQCSYEVVHSINKFHRCKVNELCLYCLGPLSIVAVRLRHFNLAIWGDSCCHYNFANLSQEEYRINEALY